jgi:hypothetical protein
LVASRTPLTPKLIGKLKLATWPDSNAASRARSTALILTVAATAIVVSACGSSLRKEPSAGTRVDVAVQAVERAFVSRPFGGSLPIVLVYVGVITPDQDARPTLSFRATGSDGRIYQGAAPLAAKVCGLPDYVGDTAGMNLQKTVAFIVPDGVRLLDLKWREPGDAEDNMLDLPAATVVCSP